MRKQKIVQPEVQTDSKKMRPRFLKLGLQLLFLLPLIVLLSQQQLSLQFNFNAEHIIPSAAEELSLGSYLGGFVDQYISPNADMPPANTSQLAGAVPSKDNRGNTYSNMTYQADLSNSQRIEKRRRQEAYVKRFAEVAKSEMKRYGIPASITLAQGLIESNAGGSRLSRENNNHFGMKCFSKACKKGHCSNFTDDSHKDFFRKYPTAWESYRAHSLLLQGKRYIGLRQFGKDYKKWAQGLKKAGYATDPRYAEKLIHIIEELNLNRYDQ